MKTKKIGKWEIKVVGFICLKCREEFFEEEMYSRCYGCGQGICFDCAKKMNLKGVEK